MSDDDTASDESDHAEYQYACPVCNADTGDITYESRQKAIEFAPDSVECASCGVKVTPAVVDRSARAGSSQGGNTNE